MRAEATLCSNFFRIGDRGLVPFFVTTTCDEISNAVQSPQPNERHATMCALCARTPWCMKYDDVWEKEKESKASIT